MANHLVIFPADNIAEAEAYKAWADERWRAVSGEPEGVFTLVRPDASGQWVTAYLGPPYDWDGEPFEEPEGGETMRAAGVISDSADWPDDEEEAG